MATAKIRFSDLSSISFNDDWKGCANYQRVPFAQKFLITDLLRVQFAINSDAPLPVIHLIDKCTGEPVTFTVTFVLDFATPQSVSFAVAPGSLVSISQTPAELGFTLPINHVFQAWTYLGQDVTEVLVNEDIVIEGRVETLGENLLYKSKSPRFNSESFYSFRDNTSKVGALTIYDVDFDMICTRAVLLTNRCFSVTTYPPININGTESIFAFSVMMKAPAIANMPNIIYAKPEIQSDNIRVWINGEECAYTWHNTMGYAITVPTIPIDQFVTLEIVGSITNRVGTFQQTNIFITPAKTGSGNSIAGTLFALPKMEDVSDRAPADQRATAWIPSIYDPVETPTEPIDPEQPIIIGGSTDLAENLIERYSDGTNTVYDLNIDISQEGDYEVQFSYDGEVVARGPFEIRTELCCSKLLQYNNRENDFGTIFTPDNPFYTRIEGEFRPEDDEYGVEDEDFRDQDYTLHQMSASPTTVRKLSFGGEYGSPNFIGNKVNRIFACSEVYVDGERYVRADGAGVTKEIWSEDYPKYQWKINVEKREQGFFKVEYTIPETT